MINNIRLERVRNNMTQQALAERLNVSRQTINAIERGKFNPSTILALKISHCFGLPVNDIFRLEAED